MPAPTLTISIIPGQDGKATILVSLRHQDGTETPRPGRSRSILIGGSPPSSPAPRRSRGLKLAPIEFPAIRARGRRRPSDRRRGCYTVNRSGRSGRGVIMLQRTQHRRVDRKLQATACALLRQGPRSARGRGAGGRLSKVQSVDQRMRLGMRCRLSPTADVPSHTSGAVMCHEETHAPQQTASLDHLVGATEQ